MTTALSTLPLSGVQLPPSLAALEDLAVNLYWTWTPAIQDVFREIDPQGWAAKKGPAAILRSTHRLPELAKDKAFVEKVALAKAQLDAYLSSESQAWFPANAPHKERLSEGPVAYFCAEYAFFEGFNQYAGGLGILAGDHCKEASDLGLPFVGVGLFYRRGFFHQMIDWSGRQEHLYRVLDPEDCSAVRASVPGTQEPLVVTVPMDGRDVHAAVWVLKIGRIPVVLLDTDLDSNRPEDRVITSQLYCNFRSMRLHQETVLGVGGAKALAALGISPKAWHMNEGHSALLLLERLVRADQAGIPEKEARAAIRASSIITIHTPVPEGNERFDRCLAEQLIAPIIKGSDLKLKELLDLGLGADKDPGVFDMTAFALRQAHMANGVSLLHGRTADKTWRATSGREVIGVTNGVHVATWMGPQMGALLASKGADFSLPNPIGSLFSQGDRPDWDEALNLGDEELWDAHMAQKRTLLALIERRLREQLARHGEGPETLDEVKSFLSEEGLLIGFARRFAPYKRASLILTNRKKAAKILDNPAHLVQIVFSGKSHPADRGGQALVEKVWNETRSSDMKGRLLYIEDYDMELGRALTQGVDVWLNNPRRPLEASGTSGMKAAMNGIPNASILDGWWDEGFIGGKNRNGFAIGGRDEAATVSAQDKRDAASLYKCLEKEVIPLFFQRDPDGLPRPWIRVMRRAIATSLYSFSTARMLRDYWMEMYEPSAR
jgi:starch phosphorylase